jgi:hypothetical protein
MSGGLTVNSVVARGRFQLGYRLVTAAELAGAGGLLTIPLTDNGAFVVIEAGATLEGITVRNRVGDDLTDSDLDLATVLVLVASPVAPYTVTLVHDSASPSIPDDSDKLWIPSLSTPGSFGNGVLGQHNTTLTWCPLVQRWRVPWTAT